MTNSYKKKYLKYKLKYLNLKNKLSGGMENSLTQKRTSDGIPIPSRKRKDSGEEQVEKFLRQEEKRVKSAKQTEDKK